VENIGDCRCDCFLLQSLPLFVSTNLTYPNVFTPNGDNQNDYFEVRSSCYYVAEAHIYNRWGELIRKQLTQTLFGTEKAKDRPSRNGSYYYVMTLKNSVGDLQPARGTLTLIR